MKADESKMREEEMEACFGAHVLLLLITHVIMHLTHVISETTTLDSAIHHETNSARHARLLLPMIMPSKFGASSSSIAMVFDHTQCISADRQYQVAINSSVHARFTHVQPTPRKPTRPVRSLTTSPHLVPLNNYAPHLRRHFASCLIL